MAGALNVFKTVTANLTTSSANVYSTPIGYSTVVLLAQISNNDAANNVQITANLARSGGNISTVLVRNITCGSAPDGGPDTAALLRPALALHTDALAARLTRVTALETAR